MNYIFNENPIFSVVCGTTPQEQTDPSQLQKKAEVTEGHIIWILSVHCIFLLENLFQE